MIFNYVFLNFLTNLSEWGLGLMGLAFAILTAMVGIAYTLDDEGKNKNLLKPILWFLIIFTALTWAGKILSNKWKGETIESMMKKSDAKVEKK